MARQGKEVLMIAGISVYNLLWYFLFYSFGGWVVEVIYHAVRHGKIVNRGFLNGPICPIYGMGVDGLLIVMHLIQPVDAGYASPVLVFIVGTIVCTLVELIVGWLLDVRYHSRWWDYSNLPLNFHGYICLGFSLVWGLAVVLVFKVVHPWMQQQTNRMTDFLPQPWGWILLAVFYTMLLADLIVTLAFLAGLEKEIKELGRIRASMRKVSNGLTETIGNSSVKVAQTVQHGQVQAALGAREGRERLAETLEEEKIRFAQSRVGENMMEMQSRYDQLVQRITTSHSAHRIFTAFPDIHLHEGSELKDTFSEIKEKLTARIDSSKKGQTRK